LWPIYHQGEGVPIHFSRAGKPIVFQQLLSDSYPQAAFFAVASLISDGSNPWVWVKTER
jgi:hypothetical protein